MREFMCQLVAAVQHVSSIKVPEGLSATSAFLSLSISQDLRVIIEPSTPGFRMLRHDLTAYAAYLMILIPTLHAIPLEIFCCHSLDLILLVLYVSIH